MTNFKIQAKLAEDRDLISRVAACIAGFDEEAPWSRAEQIMWKLAVRPGWCCQVSDGDGTSAEITDSMILEAVESLLYGVDGPAKDAPEDPVDYPEPEEDASPGEPQEEEDE